MQNKNNGFTLVELLIVLAVIAIIYAFAIPAYTEQVNRGKRADGKAFLLELASQQERFFTLYASYASTLAAADGCAGAACGLGLEGNYSPEKRYTATITLTPSGCSSTAAPLCVGFTLVANPVAADEKCPSLTFDNTGKKGVSGVSDADQIDYCWR